MWSSHYPKRRQARLLQDRPADLLLHSTGVYCIQVSLSMDSAYSVTSCCARSASRRIRTEKIIKSWTLPLLVKKTRDMLADKLGSSTSTCDGVISQALNNVQTNIEKLNNQTEQASAKVTEFSKLLIDSVEKRQNELLAELDDLRYKKI
eukprot:scpid106983/ scgid24306/ 